VPRAGSLDLLRDPRRECLGSARVRPPRRNLSTTGRDDQDASCRLMQPTFSKTSTHALYSQRPTRGRTACDRRTGVSTTPNPLRPAGPAASPSVVDSMRPTRSPDSDAPSPTRASPVRITRRAPPAPTETLATTAPLSAAVFRVRDAFRRSGTLVEPLADLRAPVAYESDRLTPFHPLR
jgi:hypothetical protein